MTEESPIQDKNKFGFPTETQANGNMPNPEKGWREVETHTYRNHNQDLLYLKDTYTEGKPEPAQTELTDYHEDRYEIRLKNSYQPAEQEGQLIHSTMDWQEAQDVLEAKTQ